MRLSLEQLKQLLPSGGYVDNRVKNYYTTCPKCNHNEFGISLDNNHIFACFRKKRCGFKGNIFTLLRFLNKPFVGFDSRVGKTTLESNVLFTDTASNELALIPTHAPIGWTRIFSHSYLNDRNFSLYSKFEVGTCLDPRYKNYVVFLIRQNNILCGYTARHLWSKQQIDQYNSTKDNDDKIKRWKNSTATDFANILYGVDECVIGVTDTLILVEGIFDKEAVDRKLKLDDQQFIKCCCTFKCHISSSQLLYMLSITSITNIILLYDPDVLSEVISTALFLQHYFSTILVCYNDIDFKDPADTNVDLLTLIETAKSPIEFRKSKVDAPPLLFI